MNGRPKVFLSADDVASIIAALEPVQGARQLVQAYGNLPNEVAFRLSEKFDVQETLDRTEQDAERRTQICQRVESFLSAT